MDSVAGDMTADCERGVNRVSDLSFDQQNRGSLWPRYGFGK